MADNSSRNIKVNGVAPQLDDTDKLAVSLYGNSGAAGDTSLVSSAAGVVYVMQARGSSGVEFAFDTAGSDAKTDAVMSYWQRCMNSLYNGTTWNRQRNNEEVTLLASAARSATTTSDDQTNYNAVGVVLMVDVTLDPAAASVTPRIQAIHPVSGDYFNLWVAGAAITATGNFLYVLYPGNTDGGQLTDKDTVPIPRQWRLQMTHADADSITYSVGASYIL
ncbi:hypothetical protein CMI37_13105 [Candidatus Pacearchaeota archaeon]|nr:hypothetical protein [Candidatus Pacearchaeota archaeon]|tara:strand:+ start:7066 stop:7725 length:660 start_codon:yes stop_codon:yes gene_type:complete